ncbi:hypothetical protein [Nostoc foliaceum]|nr:hypothetical protein [Nostoc foliaceum]
MWRSCIATSLRNTVFLLSGVGAQAFTPVGFERRGKAIAKTLLNH